MKLTNLSAEPVGRLYGWLPPALQAEEIVFLPDACPGKSPLPTGTAVLTQQENWRHFAVSDCGCGMRMLRSTLDPAELTMQNWEQLADLLRANKGRLGDLGGGNHFLDAVVPCDDGPLHFVVHTGSRNESGLVDEYVDQPDAFDREFARVVDWARANREAIGDAIQKVFGRMDVVLDLPHNTWQKLDDGRVVIRKGSVHLQPGEISILPSHMTGDMVLIEATERVHEILCSVSHGTGRTMPRGACRDASEGYDFAAMRRQILIPDSIADASLRTDAPYAYRDLDACLQLLDGYVRPLQRYSVVGYLGHL